MVRSSWRILVPAFLLLGMACAKSDERGRKADLAADGLMPAGSVGVEVAYISDQGTVTLLPKRADLSYEPLDTFRKARAEQAEKSADESTPGGDAAMAGDAGGDASKGDEKASIIDRFKASLAGAGASGKPPADASAPPAPEAAKLANAKPAVTDIPPHPAGKSGGAIEQARDDAVAGARVNLIRAIFAVPIDPATTLADVAGDEALSMQWELGELKVTAMKWLNAGELEVEVQIAAGAALSELEKKLDSVDFSPLKGLDRTKCFTAKGVGKLVEREKAVTPAGPGERAKRAAEGAGI